MPKIFNISIVYHSPDDVRLMMHYDTKNKLVHMRQRFSNIDELRLVLDNHYLVYKAYTETADI